MLAVVGIYNSLFTSKSSTSAPLATSTTALTYITPTEAWSRQGEFETVRVKIMYTYVDSADTEFLDQFTNYTSGFVVCIYASDVANFSLDPASSYQGDTIDVSGTISSYDGYLEILNPTSIVVAS